MIGLLLQFDHGLDCLLDWGLLIQAMDVEQVDAVNP